MLKRLVAVVIAIAGAGACVDSDEPSAPGADGGGLNACLYPRDRQARPAGGWVTSNGRSWNPQHKPGEPRDSKVQAAITERLREAAGPDFRVRSSTEHADEACVRDRHVVLDSSDGAVVVMTAVQLREPTQPEMPLTAPQRVSVEAGGELLLDTYFDSSATLAVYFSGDGLAVYLRARSSTSPDITGWPTTTTAATASPATQASPFTTAELSVIVQKMAGSMR